MDIGQSSLNRTPACSLPSTALLEDTTSCNFPLVWSVPKISSRKDGSDPQRVPRMHWNCRWHHHTWLHWGRTWCPPTRSYVYCLQIWLGVQPTEDTHESPSHQFLRMPIQCQWCPSRPWKGWCCACITSTHKHHRASGVLRSSHIPKSLHPWSIHLDCPSVRAAQEGCRLQLELHLWHHFWADQGSHRQWHHPQVLWPITTSDNPSWCLTGRPWCSTSAKWQTHSLCQQGLHQNWMPICKHREREMLAAVFGVERFHTYIYGRSFTIESDHKPLESISRKNLVDMPAWLQCMMLCLQGYDFTIHYCPGKEMVIPDTLSRFSPQPGPDMPLDIAIHHARIIPDHKEAFQQAFVNDPEMRALADLIITGWPKDIKEVPHPLHPYWQHQETLTVKDGLVLQGEALTIPSAERERTLHQLHQFHQEITKAQLLACGSFFWPSINKPIEEVVHQCETCTWFQSQNAAAPLTPTPTPSHPWQMCTTDIFTLEGVDHLVVGDFYSKMIFVWCLPPGQSNANKVVSLLKEMFSEHGIPEVLHSDNGPQYASAQFADFCISWGISQETSSPHYLQSNRFAEACVRSTKHALQQAKYSGADPHLALLALWATPINTKFPSPAELLYQCWLRTTILAKIHNSDPSSPTPTSPLSRSTHALNLLRQGQADKCSKTLAPLYAGQPVATYDTLQRIWVPATVICVLPQNCYQVCTSNGSTYCHMQRHLCEHSVKAANTVPSGTTATLQALSRHHFLATPPAPHMQAISAAPATPATEMKQAPAVPALPAVQKNALAPKSVTSHATPVQPQRSGHAHLAPTCLIQEI